MLFCPAGGIPVAPPETPPPFLLNMYCIFIYTLTCFWVVDSQMPLSLNNVVSLQDITWSETLVVVTHGFLENEPLNVNAHNSLKNIYIYILCKNHLCKSMLMLWYKWNIFDVIYFLSTCSPVPPQRDRQWQERHPTPQIICQDIMGKRDVSLRIGQVRVMKTVS